MKSNRFYLACLRDNVGTSVAFHCKNGKGYSTNVNEAHVYTLEEAQEAWEHSRGYDQPLCADRVDKLLVYKTDCQKVPNESPEVFEPREQYVGYEKGRWNGNDLYWLQILGSATDDYSLAGSTDKPKVSDNIVWVLKSEVDKIARPTFDERHINKRSMCQAAGLRVPDWIKKARRRSNTGLTRWNCPTCGKISWQHNPYDFDGCRDICCNSFAEPWSD